MWKDKMTNKVEWISVKDRLPDDQYGILLYTGSQISIGYYDTKNFKFIDDSGRDYIPITHWAELPEPPEKE